MHEQGTYGAAIGEIHAELQGLRAGLDVSRRKGTPWPSPPESDPEVWVVVGRDPDDGRRVSLVAVEFSERAAAAAVARVRAHEATTKNYPFQLVTRRARAGTNYLYDLDNTPEVRLF